ncbi:MAG: ABC transporter permease, partial [Anaerococcus sp.]|nr:ABC transporter permease [Anaerococcus sp.]
MSRFLIVTSETWKKQMKSPSFWLMVAMPFIALAVVFVIGYFANKESSDKKVAIVADKQTQEMFSNNEVIDFVFRDEKTAKKDLDKKKITAYA